MRLIFMVSIFFCINAAAMDGGPIFNVALNGYENENDAPPDASEIESIPEAGDDAETSIYAGIAPTHDSSEDDDNNNFDVVDNDGPDEMAVIRQLFGLEL